MATKIGPIVSKLLQRVRDPQASTHSRAFVRTLLTHTQQVVNSLLGLVISSSSLTVEPELLVYQASSSIPEAVAIIDVVHQGRSLQRSSLDNLKGIDPYWARARGHHLDLYAPIGKDLLVLYPGLWKQETVTVHYIKDTGLIDTDEDTVSIAKDFEPLMETITEAILLLKQRDMGEAESMIKMIGQRAQEVDRG